MSDKLLHERLRKAAVLDADGVETYKGDTVYDKFDGTEHTVLDVLKFRQIDISIGKNSSVRVDASRVTHKEPDSLEKLRDYVEECQQQEYGSARDAYREIADRLTALMERDA